MSALLYISSRLLICNTVERAVIIRKLINVGFCPSPVYLCLQYGDAWPRSHGTIKGHPKWPKEPSIRLPLSKHLLTMSTPYIRPTNPSPKLAVAFEWIDALASYDPEALAKPLSNSVSYQLLPASMAQPANSKAEVTKLIPAVVWTLIKNLKASGCPCLT